MKRHQRPDDEPLRALLRAGDPANDGQVPTSMEIDQMRRRMLNAAAKTQAQRGASLPVLRWAAAVAAVFVVTLAGWQALRQRPAEAPGVSSQTPTLIVEDGSTGAAPESTEETSSPWESVRPAPVAVATAGVEPEDITSTLESAESPTTPAVMDDTARSARQMQFVTARGTRIIWTLNPELDLGSLRPEKGETS